MVEFLRVRRWRKTNRKFRVQCLSKLHGFPSAQVFEKEINVVSYDKAYKPLMFPWTTELDDDVKRTGKTFSKY